MRIITYQRKCVIDKLLKDGEYKITDKSQMGTFNYIMQIVPNERWKLAYDHMFDRMKKKIKNKRDFDEDIIAPIWGWYKMEDPRRMAYDNRGLYRITLEIKDSKVLLSDFGFYECFAISSIGCLYYKGKGKKIAEELNRQAELEGPECLFRVYDKIFNKNHLRYVEDIQATFFKIRMKDVVSIEKVKKEDYKGYKSPFKVRRRK